MQVGASYIKFLPGDEILHKSLSQLKGWNEVSLKYLDRILYIYLIFLCSNLVYFLSQFAYASCFGSMFMLPEFHKVQQENNELRATLKDKEAINQVTKNDLLKLNRKVMELGLQVNIAN